MSGAVHRDRTSRRAAEASSASATGTIGRRVARILALPAIVVLVLLGVVASQQVQGYRSAQSTAESVKLTLQLQALIQQLQTERGITAGVLGGNPSFRTELAGARRAVDQQRATVAGLVSGGGTIQGRVRGALQQLDGLPSVRAATDGATAGRAATFAYFTQQISALSTVDVGLDQADDTELRRGATGLQALGDVSEAMAQERAFLNGVFSAGGFRSGEFVQFAAMRAQQATAAARFDRVATPDQKASYAYVFGTGPASVYAHFEDVALEAADGRAVVVNPQSWWSGMTTVLDDLQQLKEHVGSVIQIRAHTLQVEAAQRLAVLLAAVLVCLGGSVLLAVLASLSITRPLAALAAEADSVASDRLPSAVHRVRSGDEDDPREPPAPVQVPARATKEISSVASALDHLQSAAYDLAAEQATQRWRTTEALANLGRRNQNLIRRQLGFITSLEREEIDPAALANLFELDHLATRMRRNAASLLVLVGASSPRQWSSPVAVADVIRAAVSEVEEYRRVALRRVDEVQIVGTAVGSVAHLLSELIENGLSFSPPDSEVEVQGRSLGNGYLIAITDQGIGMNADDLALANARLRGEGDFIAAPTRFLGHFVVGELARECGIDVELVPSPLIGVTARVVLPQSLISVRRSVEAGPSVPAQPAPEPSYSVQPLHPAHSVQSSQASVSVLDVQSRSVNRPVSPAPSPQPAPDETDETDAPAAAGPATAPMSIIDPWPAPGVAAPEPPSKPVVTSVTSLTSGSAAPQHVDDEHIVDAEIIDPDTIDAAEGVQVAPDGSLHQNVQPAAEQAGERHDEQGAEPAAEPEVDRHVAGGFGSRSDRSRFGFEVKHITHRDREGIDQDERDWAGDESLTPTIDADGAPVYSTPFAASKSSVDQFAGEQFLSEQATVNRPAEPPSSPPPAPPDVSTPGTGTPVVGTPVVGTPVVGTPVVGTPVVDRPTGATPETPEPSDSPWPVFAPPTSTPAAYPPPPAAGPPAAAAWQAPVAPSQPVATSLDQERPGVVSPEAFSRPGAVPLGARGVTQDPAWTAPWRPPAATGGEARPADRPAAEAEADASRTKNGLRKRIPRNLRSGQPSPSVTTRRVIDLTAVERGPVVDDSPDQVRSRLLSLRSGVQRGHEGRSEDSTTDHGSKESQ